MTWVVRIEDADPNTIEIAATLAEATGWAQDGPVMFVGLADRAAAAEFAAAHGGTMEMTQPWAQEETARVRVPTGVIELEVGTAFGHGAHATTRLALNAIFSLGPGDQRTLLDVGTGTGILGIAAAQQGFVVTGCDIDPEAVEIAVKNARRNRVAARASFVSATPSQLATPVWVAGSRGFDVVVINALVGVHEAEGAAIVRMGSSTATIIATGFQNQEQIDRAVSSYAGFHVVEQRNESPWSLVVLRPYPIDRLL